MSGIWQRAASGPAWSVAGNRAPSLRGTTTARYGRQAAGAAWVNAAGRAPRNRLSSSMGDSLDTYRAPSAPERMSIALPYSSRPELTAPITTIKQESVGDWFASFGDEVNQLVSGGAGLNIGNLVPFLMERGPVLASKAAEALATPFLGPATAKQVTTDALNAAMAPIIGVSEFLAPIMNAPRDMFLDSQLDGRADFVRWMNDPRPLDQTAAEYFGKDWLGSVKQIRGGELRSFGGVLMSNSPRYWIAQVDAYRLANPGASEATIRQLLVGSVDLPDTVKAAVIANPTERGSVLAGQSEQGRMFSYGTGAEGVISNLVMEGSILALEIIAGKGILTGVRASSTIRAIPGAARAGKIATKTVSVASKISRGSIMAGTGALGVTTMMQTVARYQGDQAAYDAWQRINETQPLSSNADVAFVTSFAATGLEGLAFLKRGLFPIGRGVAVPIGKIAGRAGYRLLSADDLVTDRLAYMFADDAAEGRRVLDRYLPTMGARRAALMDAASDIVISRLDVLEKAALSAIEDGIERTEAVMRRHAPELFAVIKDESHALREHWRGAAWQRHFGDFGLEYHPAWMGNITADFQAAKGLSYEYRNRLQGVVGMVEYVTPERNQALRVELRSKYANAGDIVAPDDLYRLGTNLPGLRHDFRNYRLKEEGAGRAVSLDSLTRAQLEEVLQGSDARYAYAAKVDPASLRTGVATPLSPEAHPAKIADAVGSDESTIFWIQKGPTEQLVGDALERVKLFLEQRGVLTEEVMRGMSAEAIQKAARAKLDDLIAPMNAAWFEQSAIRDHIVRATHKLEIAVGAKDDVAIAAARNELERLTSLRILAYDPVDPFSAFAVGAVREQKLSDAMRAYDAVVENRARARDAIADYDALTDQLWGLTDLGDGLEHLLRYSPRTGWQITSPSAPRFGRKAESNIHAYFNGRGMPGKGSSMLDGSDEAIAYKLKLWATGGHGWKADKGSAAALSKMVGPGNAKKILRGAWDSEPEANVLDAYIHQRGIEGLPTGGMQVELMEQITRIMDQREAVLDSVSDIGNRAAVRRAAEAVKDPVIPPRVREAFRRRLMSQPAAITEAREIAENLGSMTDAEVSTAMKKWGFRWGREDEVATIIDGSYWRYGVHDPLWETTEHPLNVERLRSTIDGWHDYDGGVFDDAQEARVEAIFDADRILASRATEILKNRAFRGGLGDMRRVPMEDELGSLQHRGGLPDWTALSKGDLEVILGEREQVLAHGPLRGEIDDAVRIGDNAAIEAAWKRRMSEPPPPEPPFEESVAATEAMAGAPLPARQSTIYLMEVRKYGGSPYQRPNVAVLNDAANKTGLDVISVIQHGVIGVQPATIRGPWHALREIENGNAAKLGLGPDLLAEGQKVANKLLDAGVRDARAAAFDLGVLSHGLSAHGLEEAEWQLARELAGKQVTWDARGTLVYRRGAGADATAADILVGEQDGLQYGAKTRPMNVMESAAEVKRRLDSDVTGELADLKAQLRPGGPLINRKGAYQPGREAEARAVNLAIEELSKPRLVRPGSVPTEFATMEARAEVRNVPSLAEELLTEGFQPFERRLDEAMARQAFNVVFKPSPAITSSFGKNPWQYLVGALPNEAVGAFVKRKFTERVVANGLTAEMADAIWARWEEVARESPEATILNRRGLEKAVYDTPSRIVKGDRPRYASVRNIPTADLTKHAIDAIGDLLARTGEGVPFKIERFNFGWMFRQSASPVLRHLDEGLDIAGKRIQIPLGEKIAGAYGKVATNKAVTTLYPIFRFALDLRFWAMNYLEPYFLAMGRAGLRGAPRYGTAGLGAMTKDYLAYHNRGFSMFGEAAPRSAGKRMDQAYGVFLKERTGAVETALRSDDELMEQALREIAKTDDALSDAIVAFESGDKVRINELDAVTAKRARELLDRGTETWLKELDAWHGKILRSADPASAIDGEIAAIVAANPSLDALAARVGQANKAVWDDVHELFWGKTDRSRLERILNHPLLFWPLSYQLRSGKWLIDTLFVKMGGVPTHAYGAYELDKAMAFHNDAMANDPGYREWIGSHRTLLFAASMLFPMSPDGMGVSLTPFLRDVFFDRNKSVFDIGPVYTLRPGGMIAQATMEVWKDLKSIPEVRESLFGGAVEGVAQGLTGKQLEYDLSAPPPVDYTPVGQITGEPDNGQWR